MAPLQRVGVCVGAVTRRFCDYRDWDNKCVNVVDKEFAPMVPEGVTPLFRE